MIETFGSNQILFLLVVMAITATVKPGFFAGFLELAEVLLQYLVFLYFLAQ